GDELSIRGGLVAGDKAVTVKSITKIDGPTRVYNLEVTSLDGQITHNYFVGEDEIWTHNLGKKTCAVLEFVFNLHLELDGDPETSGKRRPQQNPPSVSGPEICDTPSGGGKNRPKLPNFTTISKTNVGGTFGNLRF
ncbi:MAG: hypothetical protein ABJJ39_08440, partial [Kangiellaceae bacterium]